MNILDELSLARIKAMAAKHKYDMELAEMNVSEAPDSARDDMMNRWFYHKIKYEWFVDVLKSKECSEHKWCYRERRFSSYRFRKAPSNVLNVTIVCSHCQSEMQLREPIWAELKKVNPTKREDYLQKINWYEDEWNVYLNTKREMIEGLWSG